MNGVVTINGRAMIQVLPRCKLKAGRAVCGFCGSGDVRLVHSSAHDAALVNCCGVWQFVRPGGAMKEKV